MGNGTEYFQTSAYTGENVNDAFEAILEKTVLNKFGNDERKNDLDEGKDLNINR